jgi:DNA-binding protein HU-beta
VNKRELSKAVAVHSDVDVTTVSKVLEGFTNVVTSVVSKGESVLITGFAKFAKVERAARMGRNPATGEQIHIKASKRARITPAKTFKDAILSPTGAPKLARGAWPVDAEVLKRAGKSHAATAPAKKAVVTKKGVVTKKAAAAKKAPRKASAKKPVATKKAPAKRAAVARKTRATKRIAEARKATVKNVTTKRSAAKRVAGRRHGRS